MVRGYFLAPVHPLPSLLPDWGFIFSKVGMELRCQCINRESRFMKPKQIKNIELIPKGSHCAQVEVIASIKSGHHICLDPSAAWVKIVIQNILKR
ncbi:interleukin-8-like [Huso huso]|uniref:C-X-C motif chemokine n=1 Tax=Huso huso TaxID=61971 RepID=A0ABR1AAG2_HUSHU